MLIVQKSNDIFHLVSAVIQWKIGANVIVIYFFQIDQKRFFVPIFRENRNLCFGFFIQSIFDNPIVNCEQKKYITD